MVGAIPSYPSFGNYGIEKAQVFRKSMFKRTYGWVQNPADFNKLQTVVQIFDPESMQHEKLKNKLVGRLILNPQVKKRLNKKLRDDKAVFTYGDLVGTSSDANGRPVKTRKEAVADGLIQISILPQNYRTTGKEWTDNWTSDGYLRWALSLNFVEHDRNTDNCYITESGRKFARAQEQNEKEALLAEAFLAYPPACRILDLLRTADRPLNKFELGEHLGFKNEKGFTNYSSASMKNWLKVADPRERNEIKANVEGTSDKYARMICSWLYKVGYVEKCGQNISTARGPVKGFPEYTITAKGIHALKQSDGNSSNACKPKYINWEFLAIAGADDTKTRDYIRTRRSLILKFLKLNNNYDGLIEHLRSKGFMDPEVVIQKDIEGLNNIGIRIQVMDRKLYLKDVLVGLTIPDLEVNKEIRVSNREKLKNRLMEMTDLPTKFYSLIDVAYDGKASRDFEIQTIELMTEVYGMSGTLLGGPRKPDGIVYRYQDEIRFGLILDTKSYSRGYSKNIQQEDEMVRYIQDFLYKDANNNPSRWWENFDEEIPHESVYFLWVSSKFIGQFQQQLVSCRQRTGARGGALAVDQLLIGADQLRKGKLDYATFSKMVSSEKIVDFTK